MTRRLLLLAAALGLAAPAEAQFQVLRPSFVAGVTDASGGAFSVRASLGEPVIGAVSGGAFSVCQGSTCVPADTPAGVQLALTVLLAGAYEAGTMRTALRAEGDLPTSQPYAASAFDGTPLDYDGLEVSASLPATAVDWVLVELRSSPAAADRVATVAALLLADGSVVPASGSGALALDGLAPGTYHVVVRHRNHLPAMTATGLALGSGTTSYDFTTGQARGYSQGGDALVGLGASGAAPFALWAGDGTMDGFIDTADRNTVWRVANGGLGYDMADFNLDGFIDVADRNNHWRLNNGRAVSQVPEGGGGAMVLVSAPDSTTSVRAPHAVETAEPASQQRQRAARRVIRISND
ncbi:MAG: hypothetical protein AAGK21_11400 [Bacteroidota bacterium]